MADKTKQNNFHEDVWMRGTPAYDNWAKSTFHGPFSVYEMDVAFTRVQDKDHWKNPVNAVVEADEVEVTRAAVAFYTGSEAHFEAREDGRVNVWAEGYYNAVGA